MNWEERSYGEWRCVDSSGRIIARVQHLCGEYMAAYEESNLGSYVSIETAKKAVEDKARAQ